MCTDNARMAKAQAPPAVKLICGMIASRTDLFSDALEAMQRLYGPVDVQSETMDFDFTDYYTAQMGSPLYRRFIAFERLISPEVLIDAKLATNELEDRLAAEAAIGPPRPINLDPGYVETSKLVLASMKNFSHRIYLGRGVYGEVTLIFRDGDWRKLAWTFPDYACGRYFAFLSRVRTRLRQQVRRKENDE